MEVLIPFPAACEVRSMVKLLIAQSIEPIKIHHELCQDYGSNTMIKQVMRSWCRQFSEGHQSAHDEKRIRWPSLINVELVRQHVMEIRRFTFTELIFCRYRNPCCMRLSLSIC
ncbi:HTH_48 domain-containing protein [Trichonephila clavipes]|nr:HTH_48 domain-containing protein [Trichonephila clavipes]